MANQVEIRITCDEFYTADFLRALANSIEAADGNLTGFETEHGIAEVQQPA